MLPNESPMRREYLHTQNAEMVSPKAKQLSHLEPKRQMFRPSRRKDSDRFLKPILGALGSVSRSNNSSNSQIHQSDHPGKSSSPKPNLSRLIEMGGPHNLASLPIQPHDYPPKVVDSSWAGSRTRRPQDTLQRITAVVGSKNQHSITPVRPEYEDLKQTKPSSSKNFLVAQLDHLEHIGSHRNFERQGYGSYLPMKYSSPERGDLQTSAKSLLRDEISLKDYSRQVSPRSVNPMHELTDRCFEQIRIAKQLQKEGQKFRDIMRARGGELVSSIFSKKASLTSVQDGPNKKSKLPKPKINITLEEEAKDRYLDFDMVSIKSSNFSQAPSRRDDFMSKSYDERSDRNLLALPKHIDLSKDLRKQRLNSIANPLRVMELRSNEATKLDLRNHRKSNAKSTSSRTSVQRLELNEQKQDSARSKQTGAVVLPTPVSLSRPIPQKSGSLKPTLKESRMHQAGLNYLMVPSASKNLEFESLPRDLSLPVPQPDEGIELLAKPHINSAAKAHELAEIRAKYRFLE